MSELLGLGVALPPWDEAGKGSSPSAPAPTGPTLWLQPTGTMHVKVIKADFQAPSL
jgi:hypothetical protein